MHEGGCSIDRQYSTQTGMGVRRGLLTRPDPLTIAHCGQDEQYLILYLATTTVSDQGSVEFYSTKMSSHGATAVFFHQLCP